VEAVSRSLEQPDAIFWGALVRDLSAGGVGLTLCYPFKPGTSLAIELVGARGICTLLARVVHVTDRCDGTWFLGCEFVNRLSDEEAASLQ
jgi:hypothetical protein